ncbi:hypothetical protein [Pseudomonas fluorescens]|uniref:Transmembrane protein n=1 Tax=Pseudomonas fluorescens TaxID=294 RepID=A0A5E7HC45_PSEFL|nr:hypothetical protein [Pseudomonas fluorescens]VVO61684.1 hypothetical protein PS847_00829 [Pseudomonas fluorescens]
MSGLSKKEALKDPVMFEQTWALALGAVVGVITLIFLMALVILAINDMPPPESVKYIIITIISFGLAFATAFLGGRAAIRGAVPFVPEGKAVEFSMAGGVAVFLIVFVVMSHYYPAGIGPSEIWNGKLSTLKNAAAKISSVDDKMIVRVNDVMLVDADYGYSGSFEFKDKLKVGQNLIDVKIFNSEYGGCSGVLQIFFDGREYEGLGRKYENNFASANRICKSFVVNFNLK